MPTVPGLVPSVSPSEAGTPAIRVGGATPDAFGAPFGQAEQALGQNLEHAGSELFQRVVAIQNLRNESAAKEADAEYALQSTQMRTDYHSLQGKAAVDALPKYQKDLTELRQKIRGNLESDVARKMYDSASLGLMTREVFAASGHAASENKKYAAGASSARIDGIKDGVLHNPTDEENFDRGITQIKNEIHTTQAPIKGWSPEQTSQAISDNVSSMRLMQITGLARTAPWKAQELLDAKRGELRYDDLERATNLVLSQTRSAGARMIASEVAQPPADGKPDERSLEDKVNEAKAKAKALAPNDPLMPEFAEQQTIAEHNRAKTMKKDHEDATLETVRQGVVGNVKGKVPTTVQELRALSPEIDKAWPSLSAAHQQTIMRSLAQNAKGDMSWDSEGKRLARYAELKGMAHNNPGEFLGIDVSQEKLPNRAKQELVNAQVKLRQNPEADPRMTRALRQLRPMLNAAKVNPADDKETYDKYVGTLQDSIQSFQGEHKREPNSKELQEMGARLLQDIKTPGTLFGDIWPNKTPLFKLPVPEAAADAIRADPKWSKMGITPNEEMIRRVYVGTRFQELYGGKAKKEEPTGHEE